MSEDTKIDVLISGSADPKKAEVKKRILDAIAQEISEGNVKPESLYHKGSFLQGHGKSAARI
jgi:hypothetical protein